MKTSPIDRANAPTGRHEPLVDLEREAIQRRISARLFGEAAAPVQIGRFLVREAIGHGGMGMVYSAHDDRLGRDVAIKVIRELAGRRGEHDRLLVEARAQARLSHPNVVQVYEVGETGDDVFVVMELVRGVTLDRWLAGARRSLAEVLAAFLAAGRGLEAAHVAGLVHRDVKPSNILIRDGGRTCIADFGLARGVDMQPIVNVANTGAQRGDNSVARTSSHAFAGTPAYMSPEHLRGRCDARSDQFSFCVALYEALYAGRPFEVDDASRLPVFCAPAAFPATPRVPRWLRRLLARGLDLAAERRFADMHALLAALEAGARRGRRLVHASIGVGIGIGVVAAALAFGGRVTGAPPACDSGETSFAGIWDPEARGAVQRAVAGSGASYADRAWENLAGALDQYTGRWRAARREACEATEVRHERSREMHARSDECLEWARRLLASRITRLRDVDPRQIAAIDEWIGSLPDPSTCLDRVRLDRGRDVAPTEPIQLGLDQARLLQQARQGRAALPMIERILDDSQAAGDLAGTSEALLLRAHVEAFDLGDVAGAFETLERAYEGGVVAHHDDVLWRISNERAVISARELQDPAAARLWLTRARSERARVGRDPLLDADLLATEAEITLLEGDFRVVLSLRREVLALRAENLPPHHPAVLAARAQVANAHAENGELREALALQLALLAESIDRWGAHHPATADVAFDTGLTCLELDELGEARRLLSLARGALTGLAGPAAPRVASIDLYLAQIDVHEGDLVAAEARARDALAFFDRHFPPHFSERLATLGLLAELYRVQDRGDEVISTAQHLLAIHDGGHPLDALPEILHNLGDYLCVQQRCAEALPAYTRLLAHYREHPPDDPARRAYPLQGLGRANLALGQPALAQPLFEQALHELQASHDPPHQAIAETARNLARSLAQQGVQPRRQRALHALAASFEAITAPTQAPALAPGDPR